MLRTSRCFAGIFLQFGGPDALTGAARFRSSLPLTNLRFFWFIRGYERTHFSSIARKFQKLSSGAKALLPELYAGAEAPAS
jgi:hypothetical protein